MKRDPHRLQKFCRKKQKLRNQPRYRQYERVAQTLFNWTTPRTNKRGCKNSPFLRSERRDPQAQEQQPARTFLFYSGIHTPLLILRSAALLMDDIVGHDCGASGCRQARGVDHERPWPPPGGIPSATLPTLDAVDFTAATLEAHVQTRLVPLVVRDAFDPKSNQVLVARSFSVGIFSLYHGVQFHPALGISFDPQIARPGFAMAQLVKHRSTLSGVGSEFWGFGTACAFSPHVQCPARRWMAKLRMLC
jgi:hypothetical protein